MGLVLFGLAGFMFIITFPACSFHSFQHCLKIRHVLAFSRRAVSDRRFEAAPTSGCFASLLLCALLPRISMIFPLQMVDYGTHYNFEICEDGAKTVGIPQMIDNLSLVN